VCEFVCVCVFVMALGSHIPQIMLNVRRGNAGACVCVCVFVYVRVRACVSV
jgi:hypothetical protein